MSSAHDRPKESAEAHTIYREVDPGGSVSSATAAVDTALGERGSGMAHESGATFHDNATSHAAADALGAKAFTAGSDVYFGAGQFSPGSDAGQSLISHELTHVAQSQGVAPPEPGNFRVSSPSDAAEVAASSGAGGGSMEAQTIHRDPTGGAAPAAGGAGPAAGGAGPAPAPGAGGPGAGTAPADPYAAFKAAVNAYDRGDATSKWGALKTEEKAKLGTEAADFQKRLIWLVHKDAPKMLKAGNCDVAPLANAIFIDDEFDQWLPEMRTHGLLTPFINAEPKKGLMARSYVTKLKSWVDGATDVREGTALFEKVYPTLLNGVTLGRHEAGLGFTTVSWALPHIKHLYDVLSKFVPAGHVQTIDGFFMTTGGKGYGWWEPDTHRVSLPSNPQVAGDPTGMAGGAQGMDHGMTGGSGSGANSDAATHGGGNNYTAPGGAVGGGANASMGHTDVTILHEVGHGVGARMGGDRYAMDPASWPGWTPLGAAKWGDELWTAPTGTGDTTVHENAQRIDAAHAKAFMVAELTGGKNSYTYDPGWNRSNPPRNDVARWLTSRYSNVPLQKWWHKIVEDGAKAEPSYKWTDADLRFHNGYAYAIYVRADEPYSKFKEAAFNQKVSFYGTSSPAEWWAEQYAHYYRTEKTGGGLIDTNTKAMLDRLDNEAWAPTSGGNGVTYETRLNKAGGDGGGAGGGGAGGGTAAGGRGTGGGVEASSASASGGAPAPGAAPAAPRPVQPLFFPW